MSWFSRATCLLAALLWAPGAFAGIDQSFEKPSGQKSWGQLLTDAVGFSSYQKSYALIVNTSRYDHYRDLPTASHAEAMRRYLLDEAGFD